MPQNGLFASLEIIYNRRHPVREKITIADEV
jgi:hypothetical protein